MRIRVGSTVSVVALLLAACSGTVRPEPDVQATVDAALAGTLAAQTALTPTPSPFPTPTPSPFPTPTPPPSPTPTPSPFPTPTPSPPPTPTPSPSPTPIPLPLPTPTPSPSPTPTPSPLPTPSRAEVIEQASESVVQVKTNRSAGTGFVFVEPGTVLKLSPETWCTTGRPSTKEATASPSPRRTQR